jgi:arabinan endo-1,5-alpha-L-arabinosidase
MNFLRHVAPALLTGIVLTANAAAMPPERHRLGTPRFHDPSTPVAEGSTWHLFSTGNGLVHRQSRDLKQWKDCPPVFKEFPAWHREVVPTQKGHLWAPDIIRLGNRYLLYYSVSSWGKNVSAIGLASSPTLNPESPDYLWNDEGIIIRSNDKDPYNAIDPQLFNDPDGSLWMVFGSFWTGIQLIELDPKTGLRHAERKKVRQLAWSESIEAPTLLRHDGWYYLFVNWGLCCRGVKSTYEMRVGRSRKITGPYLDAEGSDLTTGGGKLFLRSEGNRIGPGHPAFVEENGRLRLFYHYYDGDRGGFATLGERPIRWTKDGWPVPGPPEQ